MIKNYIKTAIRSLNKNKGFTAINILGLALGLAVSLLIVFYVVDELSYDKFNVKADRIFRINDAVKFGGNENTWAVSPAPLAAALHEFPEVESTVRFRQTGSIRLKKGNNIIQENRVTFADPSVFSVFTLPMVDGTPATALNEPHTAVINETIARKYFNTINAVGKTFLVNDTANYKVTGVIKDMPKQSHFVFDIFLSMPSLAESKDPSWLNNNFQTYVLLRPDINFKQLEDKFPPFVSKHITAQLEALLHVTYEELAKTGSYFKLTAIPVRDIHLHSNIQAEMGDNGNIQYVYIFSAIAVFILLIACVNFMNLSTARSANRAREVGVRKVLGSGRKQLITQFLAESIIVTLVSMVIAIIISLLLLPTFNQMADKDLSITITSLTWLIPAIVIVIILIGFLAGSYPAFFLSAFQPIEVLKGKLSSGFKGGFLRSFLVVFQFSISIFLIIGTLVIYNQLKFIQQKDLGYSRNQVMVVKNADALGTQAQIFKQEVKLLKGVTSASLTGFTPTSGWRNSNSVFKSPVLNTANALNTQMWEVDAEYLKTMGIKLLKGRDFSDQMLTDSTALIINQQAAKNLGFTHPVDKMLYLPQNNQGTVMKEYHVVGVMKDFNFNSLRQNVSPVIITMGRNRGALNIRFNTANTTALVAQVENKWKAINPNKAFEYSFMDQDFDGMYRAEQRIGKIFISFTSLAIIIACLGLFGLAAYAAEQRNKEIGIRKVLGAGLSSIVRMLTADFIKLVLVALVIAAPLAWFAMQQWLQGFAYRQNIQWWTIIAAGAGAILIAFATISFQSVKAALINPVKSLKAE
ncbi:ABC transporter permease [Mucilaginibacter ginkgonis]|uniref:ABC transporter permease n=1 Tax=Mucilaginibacter ginkgonis TaxID=2682091 RepID=A0A6I4HY85_9SPHI|nr:ABC transporter permease [Mucilaginibacter ginkgonis]QQL51327.1 ABC transporter permease [Mucilaginibacter ginkgonis]